MDPVSDVLRRRALDPKLPEFMDRAYSWLPGDVAYALSEEWISDDDYGDNFFDRMTEDEIRMAMLFIAEALDNP